MISLKAEFRRIALFEYVDIAGNTLKGANSTVILRKMHRCKFEALQMYTMMQNQNSASIFLYT